MKNFFTLTASLFLTFQALAQCPTGSVTLASQEMIDEYVANFPNCTEIEGDLILGDGLGSPYEIPLDFSGLSELTTIQGALIIGSTYGYDTDLDVVTSGNLSGLENITSVQNLIVGNQTDFGGLGVPVFFESLSPLNGISGSVDTLWLANFTADENLPDFSGITSLDYFRQIEVAGVTATPALPSLLSIRDFTVVDNDVPGMEMEFELTTVHIPNALTTVSSSAPDFGSAGIYISGNANLEEIIGGDNLAEVSGEIAINSNWLLADLSGFDNLETVSSGNFLSGISVQACDPDAFDSFHNLSEVQSSVLFSRDAGPDVIGCTDIAPSIVFGFGENAASLIVEGRVTVTANYADEVNYAGNLKTAGALNLTADIATSFSGFEELDSLTQSSLGFNADLIILLPAVLQLPNFSSLTVIEGQLLIPEQNGVAMQMENLEGLNALEKVGRIRIEGDADNPSELNSLDGLENLINIASGMRLVDLPSLSDVSALSTELIFDGQLYLQGNTALENCGGSPSLCNILAQASSTSIEDNGTDCNDGETILAVCVLSTKDNTIKNFHAYFSNTDQLIISSNANAAPYELRLYNALGQMVYAESGMASSNELRVQLNKTLNDGIYILDFQIGNDRQSIRLPLF